MASASSLMSWKREPLRVRAAVEDLERGDLVLVLLDELLERLDQRLRPSRWRPRRVAGLERRSSLLTSSMVCSRLPLDVERAARAARGWSRAAATASLAAGASPPAAICSASGRRRSAMPASRARPRPAGRGRAPRRWPCGDVASASCRRRPLELRLARSAPSCRSSRARRPAIDETTSGFAAARARRCSSSFSKRHGRLAVQRLACRSARPR